MWTFLAAEDPASLIVPDSVQKANFAKAVEKIANIDYHALLQSLLSESVWILIKILIALAIYFVGRWIVRRILKLVDVAMQHRNVDISLRSFTRNTISTVFTLLLVLIVVSTLGVNVTSLIAVASAATLAIGMALSGTAQNFAGGVMILLIDNYSTADLRRVDWSVGISYGDDVDVARKAVLAMLAADSRILKDPEPVVWVAALADSSVNLTIRAWVKNSDYWNVFFEHNEEFYKELPKHGLSFPFPQMDVHVKKE